MVQNGRPLGNMVIKLGLDSSAFSDSLTGATRATKTAVKEMQAGFKIADAGGNKLKTLATKQEGLTKVIQAQKNELKYLGEAYQKTYDEQGNATSKTAKAAQKYNEAQAKLAAYEAQLKTTAGQIARMKVETEGLTGWLNKKGDQWIESGKKITRFGDGVQKVGSTMTKAVTVPLAAGAIAVTKAAISWESAFAGVKKTTDEVVDSNGRVVYSYSDLESGLRGLANELPSTHTQIAAVAEAAGQLGIQTPNVVSFTKTMIDLGESTNMSAETAATELARFANITGMSQEKFSNLGSALVDLGNNFATTESEISTMALRLAGAGAQIGMSEGDILGFAAALSSVGIEAEAGGSAFSKVMINMNLAAEKGSGAFDELISLGKQSGVSFESINKAVQDGGKNLKATAGQMGLTSKQLSSMYKEADKSATSLQNFAEVAGMTNVQFANLFKENPAEAIMAFVEGLKNSEKHGKSAIAVLDDMDIKEVRLRDSLLRAANASDVFSKAVKTGNKAFGENTALAEEAGKRYETTESKIKKLRNEAVNMAIDMGGPFVDALRDGLEASKPLIKGLGNLAKSFSELDEEQQQNIIKWGLMAAAAGPALKILGSSISIFGKAKTGIGMLSKGLVELAAKAAERKALAGLTTTVAKVGTTATATAGVGGSTGIGALVTGLGAVAGPALIAVGAVAGVATALYIGKKAYDEHQLAGEKWGTKVTEEQDKVITKSYEMSEKASGYVADYANGVTDAADKAIKANKDIVDSIQKVLDKELERKKKAAEKIEDKGQKEQADKYLAWQEEVNKAEVQQAQKKVDRINAILKSASENNRTLSTQEREFISNNYKMLSDDQLKAAGFSKDQRLAIETAYQANVSKMSAKERDDRRISLETALNKERKSYEEQAASLREVYKDNPAALKASLEKLTAEYKNGAETMVTALAKTLKASGYSIEEMSEVWKQYGFTTEEVQKLVNNSAEKTSQNLDMLAKGTSEADAQWNALALDPKTGEVRTNMADTLVDIAKTDNGWQQLKFMAKDAKISTNAKEEIAIAMGEAGKWDSLYLTDKLLLVDGDEAKVTLYDTINRLGSWNAYNADRKLLGVDSADAVYKLLDTKDKLQKWNSLPPDVKTLIAKNPAKLTVEQTQTALKNYNALSPSLKKLFGDNTNVVNNIENAKAKIRTYNETRVGAKHLHATADYGEVERAREAIAQVYSKNVVINVEYRGRRTGQTAIPNAKGTNHHPGGPMLVNDQAGPLYKELIEFPGRAPFIPQGRNVIIPDAPVGTKVTRASLTKKIMSRMGIPRYEKGTGIPKDSKWVQNLQNIDTDSNKNSKIIVQNNNSGLENKLDVMISLLDRLVKKPNVLKAILDVDEVSTVTDKHLGKNFTKLRYTGGNS